MSVEGIKSTIINTCAFEAVDAIIKDLYDRAGFGIWDGIDKDIQEEIRRTWAKHVADAIRKAAGETWEEALAGETWEEALTEATKKVVPE